MSSTQTSPAASAYPHALDEVVRKQRERVRSTEEWHAHYGVAANVMWMREAACVDAPTNSFFPLKSRQPETRVREMCARCVVRAECLAYAINVGEREGYWGGSTRDERQAIRKRLRAAR